MNLEDFYVEIKNIIDYLGVTWGDKYLISVRIEGNHIVFSNGFRTVHIKCE